MKKPVVPDNVPAVAEVGNGISAAEKNSAVEIISDEQAGEVASRWAQQSREQLQAARERREACSSRRAELKEAALNVRRATEALGEKYLKLCGVIRELQATPEDVQDVLSSVGFSASRISEIKRVSFCSAELFEQFKTKLIGFKPALQKAIQEGGGKEKRGRKPLSLWERLTQPFLARIRSIETSELGLKVALDDTHAVIAARLGAVRLACARNGGEPVFYDLEIAQGGVVRITFECMQHKPKQGVPRTPRKPKKKAGKK